MPHDKAALVLEYSGTTGPLLPAPGWPRRPQSLVARGLPGSDGQQRYRAGRVERVA